MKKLLTLCVILLCCAISRAQVAAPTFSPAAGSYSSPQTVTIHCSTGNTGAYTTDGSTPNIASTEVTGTITISATTTVKALCADIVSDLQNTQTSAGNIPGTGIGYKCVTPNQQTYGSLSCERGGGVSGQPSNVTLSFGTTMDYEQTSSGTAQSLIPYFGTATGTSVDNINYMAQDVWVKAVGSNIENNEMDMIMYNHTYKINHQIGLQCNQHGANSGTWQIDSGAGTGWINTNVTDGCILSTSAYTHVALLAHWTNGDSSGPGGHGYTYYDSLCINGTCHSLTYLGGQPNSSTTFRSILGNQSQLDANSSGGTIGRLIQKNNVAGAVGAPSSVATATYTIGGTPTVSTPTASPSAGTYSSTQTVTLSSSTSGATICYTTDGSAPAASTPGTCSAGTTYSTAISVSSTETIKAIGTLASYANSSQFSGPYTISSATPVATPTASPAAGTYFGTQSVTLASSTSGATLCYTTDGSTPAASTAGTCSAGSTYSSAISVASSETIKALGTKSGDTNSGVASFAYVIGSAPPSGNIDFRQIKSSQRLTNGAEGDFFQMTTRGTYSDLPTCNSGNEGASGAISDSTSNTYGDTVSGGGSDHVHVYCNGTNWVVD